MSQKEKTAAAQKSEEQPDALPVEMRVTSLGDGKKHLANLSMNLGGAFAVRGLRLVEGQNGPFLSFPSYKTRDGRYQDICFPTTAGLRQRMTDAAVDAYRQTLEQHRAQEAQHAPREEQPEQLEQEAALGMQMQ